MASPWDQAKPDLSKLPPHLREALNAPVPVKKGESHGRLSIITRRSGLNHPNARVWVSVIEREGAKQLVLELCDHRGLPQVMLVLNENNVPAFKESILEALQRFEISDAEG